MIHADQDASFEGRRRGDGSRDDVTELYADLRSRLDPAYDDVLDDT